MDHEDDRRAGRIVTLAAILALAEKATPGPWVCDLDRDERGADVRQADPDGYGICNINPDDGQFVAALSPEVVAALVRYVMAAEEAFTVLSDDEAYASAADACDAAMDALTAALVKP